MADEVLRVDGSLSVPYEEVDVRFSASGGPGGQHANKAATRVELRFDVEASDLGPVGGQPLRGGASDAARGAGHDRHLPVEAGVPHVPSSGSHRRRSAERPGP